VFGCHVASSEQVELGRNGLKTTRHSVKLVTVDFKS